MIPPVHHDLLEVLDAVEILAPGRYSIRGRVRTIPEVPSGADPGPGVAMPVVRLGDDLYGALYLRPSPSGPIPRADPLARRDWVASLSAANTGRGTWEPGWTILRVEGDGRVVVAKEHLEFWVERSGLGLSAEVPLPGLSCRVRIGKELRGLMPGFYVAIGDSEGDADDRGDDAEPLVRYYWHLGPGAAVRLVEEATRVLNGAGIPFRLKVLSDPDAYRRADAGVLYLRRRYHGRIGGAIERVRRAVATGLRATTPMFTKRLADGLGLAEDPLGGRSSFGQHRCRLVARGLWRSFEAGDLGREARLAALISEFEGEGYDPRQPFLEPGSDDRYDGPPAPIGGRS